MTSLIAQIKSLGKSLDSMEELLMQELNDLYDGEKQMIKALPKMIEAASSPQLKQAFQLHLSQTQRQKDRLDQAFGMMGASPSSHTCEGMKGMIEEGAVICKTSGDPCVKDAALIAAAQRVEHYEMAGYGAARSCAQQVGRNDVAALLQQTLDEEGQTDHKLTDIALTNVNPKAPK